MYQFTSGHTSYIQYNAHDNDETWSKKCSILKRVYYLFIHVGAVKSPVLDTEHKSYCYSVEELIIYCSTVGALDEFIIPCYV